MFTLNTLFKVSNVVKKSPFIVGILIYVITFEFKKISYI